MNAMRDLIYSKLRREIKSCATMLKKREHERECSRLNQEWQQGQSEGYWHGQITALKMVLDYLEQWRESERKNKTNQP